MAAFLSVRATFASLLALALTFETAPAGATTEETASDDAVTEEATPEHSTDPPYRAAVTVNPLSLAVSRVSVQGELLVAKHHALTLNPFGARYGQTGGGERNAVGGEAGYRLYTGSRGPNGFFVGASLIALHTWHSGARTPPPPPSNDPGVALGQAVGEAISTAYLGNFDPTNSIGGALDVGAQFIIDPGILIGFGAGLQVLATDGVGTGIFPGIAKGLAGTSPRFLVALGYAF